MIDALRQALHRARHRQRYALLDGLLRNQSLSRTALLEKQRAELAAIIEHAVRRVPYYQKKYAGLDLLPGRLPILNKDEVIRHRDDLLAAGVARDTLKIGHTGGSTGKPVSFYYDPYKHLLMRAGMYRSYMGSGWRPGQRILNFWGARQDIRRDGLGKRLDAYLAAERTVAAYDYTEAQLRDWAATLHAYQPVLLQGYASILTELARYVSDHRIPLPGTLLGVYSTAEMLDDRQRALMEQAFGCKVYNQYGSREIPNIACECRHGNLHVFTDMVWLESLDLDGEDRLIVTSLTNRVMPFIRYDIGDSGRLKAGECACGSPFPMLEMGLCRRNDLIRTRSGKHVYPAYFIHLLDGLAGIRQYQFIQRAADRLTLNLVAASPLAAEAVHALDERIRRDVDAGMRLEIRYLDEIPRTVSGKHRFVISQLEAG